MESVRHINRMVPMLDLSKKMIDRNFRFPLCEAITMESLLYLAKWELNILCLQGGKEEEDSSWIDNGGKLKTA